MRKIIAAAFVSLDGVMQAPGGAEEDPSNGFALGGWTVPYWDESTDPFMGIFDESFDLLLGRRTYDIFAAYWPVHQEHPIGPLFNSVTKYVATSTPESLRWENSVGLTGDVLAEIAAVKNRDGPPLLTQGSSVLLHALLKSDLIDELRLMTFPVILGQGKRWFEEGALPKAFELEKNVLSTTGVTSSIYRHKGEVGSGSF